MGEELADSEAYLKGIMAAIPAGVMIIDPERHCIVDLNETASSLIGGQKKENNRQRMSSVCMPRRKRQMSDYRPSPGYRQFGTGINRCEGEKDSDY